MTRRNIDRDCSLRSRLGALCAALTCAVALFALPSAALASSGHACLGQSKQQETSARIKTVKPGNDTSGNEEVIIVGHKNGKREEVVIGGPKGSIGHVSATRGADGGIGHVSVTGG